MREPTDEELRRLPAVVFGFSGSSWPAAEKAGLVNAGGMWMTPEGLEKMRTWKKKQRESEQNP